MLELGLKSNEYVNLIRNNSAIIEIFPKLYTSRSERCAVCYKILNLKKIFCLGKKYILMIVSHGENSLNFIHYSIIFFQCIYSSTNRPFLTKNNYSSQDPLYTFYMKYSVKENRREKYYIAKGSLSKKSKSASSLVH
jgi:hypothetical protein